MFNGIRTILVAAAVALLFCLMPGLQLSAFADEYSEACGGNDHCLSEIKYLNPKPDIGRIEKMFSVCKNIPLPVMNDYIEESCWQKLGQVIHHPQFETLLKACQNDDGCVLEAYHQVCEYFSRCNKKIDQQIIGLVSICVGDYACMRLYEKRSDLINLKKVVELCDQKYGCVESNSLFDDFHQFEQSVSYCQDADLSKIEFRECLKQAAQFDNFDVFSKVAEACNNNKDCIRSSKSHIGHKDHLSIINSCHGDSECIGSFFDIRNLRNGKSGRYRSASEFCQRTHYCENEKIPDENTAFRLSYICGWICPSESKAKDIIHDEHYDKIKSICQEVLGRSDFKYCYYSSTWADEMELRERLIRKCKGDSSCIINGYWGDIHKRNVIYTNKLRKKKGLPPIPVPE